MGVSCGSWTEPRWAWQLVDVLVGEDQGQVFVAMDG